MKVLILGSGGREHALAWAVKRSARVTEVVCAPGNGGMAQIARCVPVDLKTWTRWSPGRGRAARLTIVGRSCRFAGHCGCAAGARPARLWPDKAAAMLESEQGFAKRFLQRHNIPTANYAVCTSAASWRRPSSLLSSADRGQGRWAARRQGRNHLRVAEGRPSRLRRALLRRAAWASRAAGGHRGVPQGDEISFLCLSDGKSVKPLVPAQDHKRIGEGDTGPNTGGMGVYSTDTMLDPAMTEWILRHIAVPTVAAWRSEDTPFTGVLYCG
jgi:phosphoribosylamine--glycine ligase